MTKSSQTIVITGTSRRLGLFLCQKFLAKGDQVIAITRHASSELSRLAQEYSQKLQLVLIPSYDSGGIEQALASIKQQYDHLDVLIHNASVFESDEQVKQDFASRYQALFNIHMLVPAQLNLGLQPLLQQGDNPSIVHITDIYSENPKIDFSLYCSTKAGLENLSKGFAKNFAPHIRVNSIQPGPIQFLPEHTQEQKNKVMGHTLLQREGGFLPIYQAVESLLGNHFVTGTTIKVDGGRTIGAW